MHDESNDVFPDNRQGGSLGGTLLRGGDGSLYFIRDELLDALKVEGEGQERLEEALKAKAGGVDTAKSERLNPVAYVRGSLLRQDLRNINAKLPNQRRVAASTIMCPWFC